LQTFLSLTDTDLKELGITTFGPRRKMLLAIQGLLSILSRIFIQKLTVLCDLELELFQFIKYGAET
jgi:hypothetical protein